jgi:dynein heavy chain
MHNHCTLQVRTFANPPQAVKIVMGAVCVMLGEKEDWDSAKRLLAKSDFTQNLKDYDKDNINEKYLTKLRKEYFHLGDYRSP